MLICALVPSMISFLRILDGPLIMFCLCYQKWHYACWLFIGAGITDYFDGFLARRWHVVSKIGAYLDIIADKSVMLCTSIGILLYAPMISMRWFLYVVIVREFIMIFGYLISLSAQKKPFISHILAGKINMAFQFILLSYLLITLTTSLTIHCALPFFIGGFCTILISLVLYTRHFYAMVKHTSL